MIDEYIENWLKKAGNDLKIVEHELDLAEEETVKDGACFHCQQAIEKEADPFRFTFGAWKQDESVEETVRNARKAFNQSMQRHNTGRGKNAGYGE